MAFETGRRIVGMVNENLRPSDIMTKAAFENAVVAAAALGASSNCPIHMVAIAEKGSAPFWRMVDPERLREAGMVPRSAKLVKILAEGDLTHALTVRAHLFSKAAQEKITKAGGQFEVIPARIVKAVAKSAGKPARTTKARPTGSA